VSIKTFPNEVKERIIASQNGMCDICPNPIHSIHHKLQNNKPNRKLFPLFIHSYFNGVGLCFKCHQCRAHERKLSERYGYFAEISMRDNAK